MSEPTASLELPEHDPGDRNSALVPTASFWRISATPKWLLLGLAALIAASIGGKLLWAFLKPPKLVGVWAESSLTQVELYGDRLLIFRPDGTGEFHSDAKRDWLPLLRFKYSVRNDVLEIWTEISTKSDKCRYSIRGRQLRLILLDHDEQPIKETVYHRLRDE
jgi:hypothetical protein